MLWTSSACFPVSLPSGPSCSHTFRAPARLPGYQQLCAFLHASYPTYCCAPVDKLDVPAGTLLLNQQTPLCGLSAHLHCSLSFQQAPCLHACCMPVALSFVPALVPAFHVTGLMSH